MGRKEQTAIATTYTADLVCSPRDSCICWWSWSRWQAAQICLVAILEKSKASRGARSKLWHGLNKVSTRNTCVGSENYVVSANAKATASQKWPMTWLAWKANTSLSICRHYLNSRVKRASRLVCLIVHRTWYIDQSTGKGRYLWPLYMSTWSTDKGSVGVASAATISRLWPSIAKDNANRVVKLTSLSLYVFPGSTINS